MDQFELSEKDHWKLSLKLVDATLSMLSAFEGRHIEEIDTAIDSLRKILAMGNYFNIAKRHTRQQKQEKKNRTTIPYGHFNAIADESQYQRYLQKAIKLSLEDYNISQHNAHLYKDNLQNKQSPEHYNVNTAYDYTEHQLAQDTEMAIKLSLEHEIKKNKTHGTDIYDDIPITARSDDLSITNKQRINSKCISKTATFKSGDLVRIPTLESDAKLNAKATEPKPEPPELHLADLVFPTVSAPVPVRHNVSAILQAEEEQIKANKQHHQLKETQTTGHQKQPSYQPLRQYRQQAHQQQKWQRQYQQEHLPQPITFTPRGNDYLTTETASTSSSGSILPAIVTNTTTGFEGKPCKMKALNSLQNRGISGSQQRVFEWIHNSSEAASWELYASSTNTTWKQGIDIDIAEWEKEEAKNETKTSKSPALPQGKSVVANKNTSYLIDPNICIHDGRNSIEYNEAQDNWNKEEERHDSMVIFIPQNPIRKSKGPRIFCLDDGDFESDDEGDDNETND